jgi:hypothetical protein
MVPFMPAGIFPDGEVPFLATDLPGCYDITPLIGITGTPVIDPTTDTIYFWAKSYGNPSQQGLGWENGTYRFHAIDAITLEEKPGLSSRPEWPSG